MRKPSKYQKTTLGDRGIDLLFLLGAVGIIFVFGGIIRKNVGLVGVGAFFIAMAIFRSLRWIIGAVFSGVTAAFLLVISLQGIIKATATWDQTLFYLVIFIILAILSVYCVKKSGVLKKFSLFIEGKKTSNPDIKCKKIAEPPPPDIYKQAVQVAMESQSISASLLQQRLKLGYAAVARCIDQMEQDGIVGPFEGNPIRKVLITKEEYMDRALGRSQSLEYDLEDILHTIDSMNGHDFEHWCARFLCDLDFSNVVVTKGSGDQGVDVLAEKESIRYAIQCKCYSTNLGNPPIQEVYAGKNLDSYRCQIGAVMTNRYFTDSAKELAASTGVLLWDRDWITKGLMRLKEGKSNLRNSS